MSEYQYYEFRATDRPLTEGQMARVRQFSSRAEITPTQFVNEYHWGDFRGDPYEFLAKYFDVMVYVANWGTRRLMFRVPAELIEVAAAEAYCSSESATMRKAGEHVIFDFDSQDEEGDWEIEGSGWMAGLAPLREELMNGDLRVLYLAWLLGVQAGENPDDEPEPPVPAGLGKLTTPQRNFVDFLRVDEDLLAAAAQASPPVQPAPEGLSQWIAMLPAAEKDAILPELCSGGDVHLGRKLQRRFQVERGPTTARAGSAASRTVGQLRQMGEDLAEQRRQEEARQRAKAKAEREAREAAARASHLAALAKRQEAAWADAERLVSAKQSKAYDQAVELLKDLRDVAAQAGKSAEFDARVTSLRQRHAAKSSFQQRMTRASLGQRV